MYGERERPVKALDPWSSAATCSKARPGAPGTPFSDVGCALVKDAQRPFCCVSLGALSPSQPGRGGTAVRRRAHVGNAETRPRASAPAPGTSGQLRAAPGPGRHGREPRRGEPRRRQAPRGRRLRGQHSSKPSTKIQSLGCCHGNGTIMAKLEW